jgi:CHAT domain-containing protein/uncharacterized protein HemY
MKPIQAVLLFAISATVDARSYEDAIEEAQKLNQLVSQLYDQGNYQEALSIAKKALGTVEKEQGAEHPDTAAALYQLGRISYTMDNYTDAESFHRRALVIREKALGIQHADTAKSLNSLGSIRYVAGDYGQAELFYKRAFEIREKVLGPEHPDTARSRESLARLYTAIGAYAKAEPLYQRALATREKLFGPEHQDTARSLASLASLYSDTGAYTKAEPLNLRALAIKEKELGPEHPGTAEALDELGILYLRMGLYGKAEPVYQRALAIREKSLGPWQLGTAGSLNNIAVLYEAKGAYAKAERLYQRALAIKEKIFGPDNLNTAISINNLANVYLDTGAYAKAEALYLRALAIKEKTMGAEHPGLANSLNGLASVYSATGAYEKAGLLHRRAIAIREKTLGPEHPDTAESLDKLAALYAATNVNSEAELLYLRALAIREKSIGPEHPSTANSLSSLATLYSATGAYAKAEQLQRRAFWIRQKALGSEHPQVVESATGLALLNWTIGQPSKALQLFEQAQRIQAKNSQSFLLSGSEARKQAYLRTLTNDLYKHVSFSVSELGRESVTLGISGVLQFKGRVLEATSDSVVRLRRSVRPKDRLVFDQLAEVAARFSTLTYQGASNFSNDEYKKQLDSLSHQQESLEAKLATRSSEFRRQVMPMTIESIRQVIPGDAVLVEWFRYIPFDPKAMAPTGKPHYVAYVLKRSGDPVAIDMGEAQEIEDLADGFRRALGDPMRGDVKLRAATLSEKLIKPLRQHLAGYRHWLISPDGALNLVPMAALLDDKGEYLTQNVEITYLTSGRDLLRIAAPPGVHGSAVVVANPDYGKYKLLLAQAESFDELQRSVDLDRGGLVFRPLNDTALEAQALQTLLKLDDTAVLTRTNATEANLRGLHSPRILHVASHGFFLDNQQLKEQLGPERPLFNERATLLGENPLLRSGIALAGANERRSGTNDDGILTALEVSHLDLDGTQLVVLSACESGVGEIQNGEGVYGLRRALVLAGAQTQITSLWKVADQPTRNLMVDYYQRLLKGKGRSAALREAQKTMLATPAHSHPYYWAGFVPIGNWQPLAATH